MDLEKESSAIKAPCLPPPPPPPPMLNLNANNDGRSQLLADIRKGASLKKASVTNDSSELSQSDKLKKQTQDLLQAELTNTLKRRKPVTITEPPKYEYPTYDNGNSDTSKNNNTSKVHDSSHSTNTSVNNSSPLNVNAILSVVTGIKLPDVQYDANASVAKSQSADKYKISHGKPNFTIHQKENKPTIQSSNVLINPKLKVKTTPDTMQPKLQRPSFYTSNSVGMDKTVIKTVDTKPIASANSESQVEKCKSIFTVKSQKSVEPDTAKPIKCQPKSDVILHFETLKSPSAVEVPKEMLYRKNSVDDSFVSVADKKAIFEKPGQDDTVTKASPLKNIQTEKLYLNETVTTPNSNGNINHVNGYRTINSSDQKPNHTTVTVNKNIPYGSLERPKFEQMNRDKVDHFEKSVHTIDETTTTNSHGKYETKHIEQKTFVSFSKDLLNAPNNYPDQIRVKKTIITQRSHAIPENPFNNIRFSIKTDGRVIPKPK